MVYTYHIPKPTECFDMSHLSVKDMVDTVVSLCSHHTTGRIWFGYLEGWMISPTQEVILRKALRQFECIVVCKHPLMLSHSWKNECKAIYTSPLNGDSNINNHGSIVHDGSETEHRDTTERTSTDKQNHQNRKTGRPAKRGIKKRPSET